MPPTPAVSWEQVSSALPGRHSSLVGGPLGRVAGSSQAEGPFQGMLRRAWDWPRVTAGNWGSFCMAPSCPRVLGPGGGVIAGQCPFDSRLRDSPMPCGCHLPEVTQPAGLVAELAPWGVSLKLCLALPRE